MYGHIFQKAQVAAYKNAQNLQQHFPAQFSMFFKMVHWILSVSTKKLEIEVSDCGFQKIWTTEKVVSSANCHT